MQAELATPTAIPLQDAPAETSLDVAPAAAAPDTVELKAVGVLYWIAQQCPDLPHDMQSMLTHDLFYIFAAQIRDLIDRYGFLYRHLDSRMYPFLEGWG